MAKDYEWEAKKTFSHTFIVSQSINSVRTNEIAVDTQVILRLTCWKTYLKERREKKGNNKKKNGRERDALTTGASFYNQHGCSSECNAWQEWRKFNRAAVINLVAFFEISIYLKVSSTMSPINFCVWSNYTTRNVRGTDTQAHTNNNNME